MWCIGVHRSASDESYGPSLIRELGSVGQKFIQLLADHPVLQLHAVGASSRSAGKKYRDAVRWKQTKPMSTQFADLQVRECTANNFQDCDLVFSGLDSDVAGAIGIELCMVKSLTLTRNNRDGISQG